MIAHAHPVGRGARGPGRSTRRPGGYGLGGIVAVVLDGAEGSWRVTYAATAVAALVLALPARRLLPESVAGQPRPVDGRRAAARRGHGRVARRAGREPVGCRVAVGGAAVAGVALLGAFGGGTAGGTADRSRTLPVARVRCRHRGRARRRDRGGRRRVLHADGAAARPRGVAGLGDGADAGLVRGGHGDGVAAAQGARGERWPAARRSLGVSAAGLAGLAVLEPGASLWRLLPGIVVLGLGYGGANAALGREAIAHVPRALAGMGSGTGNTARYLGSALGVTLAALLEPGRGARRAAPWLRRDGAGRGGARRRARCWSRCSAARSSSGVDDQPAAVVLVDGVRQAGRRAERVQVVEVEGADVAPGRRRLVLERTATTARRRATRSISASTSASRPRGRCSSRWTAKTVSALLVASGMRRASPARAVTGRPRRGRPTRAAAPCRDEVDGRRPVTSAASRSDRNPKQHPSSTTCGPSASAAARSWTEPCRRWSRRVRRRRAGRRGCCGRRWSSRGRLRARRRRTRPRNRPGRAGRGRRGRRRSSRRGRC